MNEYRIDELAQAAGVSVRNVRVYQERGLLPAPRREGRAAWYSDGHLARLRLIARMLERGYTFATIGELLTAAQEGLRVTDLLGSAPPPTPAGPWRKLRSAARLPLAELRRLFGEDPTPERIRRSARLGALADGVAGEDGYVISHPQLLQAAAELIEAGIPLDALLTLAEQVKADTDRVAQRFVGIVADHYLGAPGLERRVDLDAAEVAEVADLINRLRPRANQVLQVLLAQSMDVEIGKALQRAADQLGAGPEEDGGAAPVADDAQV
ncbi:MerR family transcriptional regulator [Tomitella gaofuii]|uniref:MerR family transcriptional regulator n=1 Tax=Tomitella gaofuii TaxID=2760083 RepID=UPI0015F865B4|nr:MerR family transcriptional regulator [Tomitella gaofuii]